MVENPNHHGEGTGEYGIQNHKEQAQVGRGREGVCVKEEVVVVVESLQAQAEKIMAARHGRGRVRQTNPTTVWKEGEQAGVCVVEAPALYPGQGHHHPSTPGGGGRWQVPTSTHHPPPQNHQTHHHRQAHSTPPPPRPRYRWKVVGVGITHEWNDTHGATWQAGGKGSGGVCVAGKEGREEEGGRTKPTKVVATRQVW